MQKVEVWIEISGAYCAFHEMSFSVVYDVTNDIQLNDMTLDELENFEFEDYCDYEKRNAILGDGGGYYVLF